MRQFSRRKLALFGGIAVLFGLSVGFVFCEIGYRFYSFQKFNFDSSGLVIQTYKSGAANQEGQWLEFDPQHRIEFEANVKLNSWGYRSKYNYSDQREPNEFRVAVYGDSYTECVTNNFSWVDVVHDALAEDDALKASLNVKKITVANFGRAGAGFTIFAQLFRQTNDFFKPDLVVFAFIDEDFRRLAGNLSAGITHPAIVAQNALAPRQSFVNVPGFDGQLKAARSGTSVSRALYYGGDNPKIVYDRERMLDSKAKLNREVAFENILLASGSLLWKDFVKPRLANTEISKGQYFDAFARSVEVVSKAKKPLILVNLPAFYEVVNQFTKDGPTRAFEYWPEAYFKYTGLNWISLREHFPADATYEEKYRWFSLPFDGHPSDDGALLYGKTIAQLLKTHLTKAGDSYRGSSLFVTDQVARKEANITGEADARALRSKQAMDSLLAARVRAGIKDHAGALALYSKAIELDFYIGAPGVMYTERASIHLALGQAAEALGDYNKAIALDKNPSFYIGRAHVNLTLGKIDDAKRDVEFVEKTFASNPQIIDAVRQMRKNPVFN